MRVLGGILIAVGMLIAGLSGLCVAAILAEDFTGSFSDMGEGLWIVAIIGGIPFLIGLGMIFGGWQLVKPQDGD